MAKETKTKSTVKQIDLSQLSLIDLIGLQKALPAIIEKAKQTEKASLRQKMEALAAESGFELSEVFDSSLVNQKKETKKRKQIGFIKAKYHNPSNIEQTWTGRGRKPSWAAQHIKQGGTLQDLLINPDMTD